MAQFGEMTGVGELLGNRHDHMTTGETEGLDAVLGAVDVLLHQEVLEDEQCRNPVGAGTAEALDL
jgi:hypothetical protein